jgi:hypothetical protein
MQIGVAMLFVNWEDINQSEELMSLYNKIMN